MPAWLRLDEFLGLGPRGGMPFITGRGPGPGPGPFCKGIRSSGAEVGELGGMTLVLASPDLGLFRLTILRLCRMAYNVSIRGTEIPASWASLMGDPRYVSTSIGLLAV